MEKNDGNNVKCVMYRAAGLDGVGLVAGLDGFVPLDETLRVVCIDLHDVPDRHLCVDIAVPRLS